MNKEQILTLELCKLVADGIPVESINIIRTHDGIFMHWLINLSEEAFYKHLEGKDVKQFLDGCCKTLIYKPTPHIEYRCTIYRLGHERGEINTITIQRGSDRSQTAT